MSCEGASSLSTSTLDFHSLKLPLSNFHFTYRNGRQVRVSLRPVRVCCRHDHEHQESRANDLDHESLPHGVPKSDLVVRALGGVEVVLVDDRDDEAPERSTDALANDVSEGLGGREFPGDVEAEGNGRVDVSSGDAREDEDQDGNHGAEAGRDGEHSAGVENAARDLASVKDAADGKEEKAEERLRVRLEKCRMELRSTKGSGGGTDRSVRTVKEVRSSTSPPEGVPPLLTKRKQQARPCSQRQRSGQPDSRGCPTSFARPGRGKGKRPCCWDEENELRKGVDEESELRNAGQRVSKWEI